jgi:adenylate kinase
VRSVRLVLLGAPGAGKGTQAAALADHYGVPHISSGDLLRGQVAAGTQVGRRLPDHLDRGELVPDEIVTEAVEAALAEAPASGYILEGFPRTVGQARRADAVHPDALADAVVLLELPDDLARQRLTERAAGGRSDDRDPEVIERRLRRFHAETEPLAAYYRERRVLTTVDADQPPEAVTADILAALGGTRRPP